MNEANEKMSFLKINQINFKQSYTGSGDRVLPNNCRVADYNEITLGSTFTELIFSDICMSMCVDFSQVVPSTMANNI